jgi:S-adenosyl-L-methionine hydrolase (adenosine-forming)
LQSDRSTIVCPDNGISTFAVFREANWRSIAIKNTDYIAPRPSNTFHGRDIFAPAAGHLARGVTLDNFGPAVDDPLALPLPKLQGNPNQGWEGEVLFHDHFGNAITSIGCLSQNGCALQPWLPDGALGGNMRLAGQARLENGTIVPLRQYYGEPPDDPLIAIVGSSGWLEIAAPNHRASGIPALRPGAPIQFLPQG